MKQSKKDRQRQEGEVRELEKSLQETRLLIAQAYAGFNAAADGELVESYVYEIQALQTRYSYLLRRRKALDPAPEALPVEGEWITALPWMTAAVVGVMLLSLLRRPVAALLRLAGRTGLGLAFLTFFAPVGEFLGAALGVNLFNATVLGVLGVPGFGLLMLAKWVLR